MKRVRAQNHAEILEIHPKIRLIIVILLLTWISASCQSEQEEVVAEGWKTFTAVEENVAIDYPADWAAYLGKEYRGSDETLVVVLVYHELRDLRGASVRIFHKQLDSSALTDVVAWGEERVTEAEENYELGKLETIQIGENEASALKRIIRVDTDTVAPQHIEHIYVASDYGAYIVSFMARESQFDDFTTVFDQMIATFKIVQEKD